MPGACHGSGTEARAILLMIFSRFFALAVLDTYSAILHFPRYAGSFPLGLGPRHLFSDPQIKA